MKQKIVNKNKTFLVRLDNGWYNILRRQRFDRQMSFKELVEECLSEYYGFRNDGTFGFVKGGNGQ